MLRIAVFLFLFEEYNSYLISPHINYTFEIIPLRSRGPINNGNPPEYFDWREKNMVSPVKDQMNCAACWAFAAVANIESHLMIYLNTPEILSEQFLIDCDDANKGCGYASIIQTLTNIVTKFGGVLRSGDYAPYANGRMPCRWHPSKPETSSYGSFFDHLTPTPQPRPVPVIGFRRVLPNEDTMAEYVYKYGPLSVVSDSGQRVPYWIVKNSWSTMWGDNGYYYLVRGRNACGIASDVSFAYVG